MRMKTWRIIFVFIILSGFLSEKLDAMSWPSENAVLIRNFGSNEKGKPVLGMIFSGDTKVLAAEKGEVIFSRSIDDTASRLPSPLGAWTALDHGDGLISIYSRYAETEVSVDENQSVSQVDILQPIASSGVSGWSSHNGFYFMIYDRLQRRWINPEMIITPVKETRPPQILSVDFQNTQKQLMQPRNLSQGRYSILVNTFSPPARTVQGISGGVIFAPQRIVCLVNGAEAGSLNFEAVSARDGVLMIYRNGLVPAKQIYANYPSFETAEVFLNRGQANLEIIVQDIAGNSRSAVTRLIVN
jgi:hypothetical protein